MNKDFIDFQNATILSEDYNSQLHNSTVKVQNRSRNQSDSEQINPI